MGSSTNWFRKYYRQPKTTQENRANQDRNDPYVRGRRRNLPTAWEDIPAHPQKTWKTRRKTQYRPADVDYAWHSHEDECYSYHSGVTQHLINALEKLGCYYEIIGMNHVKWFGPEWPL